MGFKYVILESDAQEIMNIMISPATHPSSLFSYFVCLQEPIEKEWEIQTRPVPREANRLADCLAKHTTTQEDRINIITVHLLLLNLLCLLI